MNSCMTQNSSAQKRLCLISRMISSPKQLKQVNVAHQINPRYLREIIFGKQANESMSKIYDVILNDKQLFNHPEINQSGRDHERKIMSIGAMKLIKLMLDIDYQHDWQRFMGYLFASTQYSASLCVKSFAHFGLYTKALLSFADRTNEVQNRIIEKALKVEDIGCFGLTQMNHGSFTRGIQTQAIYDHNNKQFVINSLNQNAMKFWIGGAAQSANMSVIVADLIVKDRSYGPHYFIVPIRNRNTYQVLQGVTAGDSGPKSGGNGLDNGFLMFKNVRIPKDYLLSKIGWIGKQGQYESTFTSDSKRFGAHMSPLSVGRATVSIGCLANCTTVLSIAGRYIHSRRQFTNPLSSDQKQVLLIEYPTTKHRFIPILAQTIVYFFAGKQIIKLYYENASELTNPESPITNQLHALSGITKSKSTWFSMDSITACRQLMGGHGYSAFNRMSQTFFNTEIATTLEGDNNLLLQQTSKYLLKAILDGSGKFIDLAFVMNQQEIDPNELENCDLHYLGTLQRILKDIIKKKFNRAFEKMQSLKQQGLKTMEIWNKAQPYYCNQMALSFGDYFYFLQARKEVDSEPKTKQGQLIKRCLKLWVYKVLIDQSYGTVQFRKRLQKQLSFECQFLSDVSLKMIDAIAPPSWLTNSPFANENIDQGMKDYINLLFTNPGTFQKVQWSDNLIKTRESQH